MKLSVLLFALTMSLVLFACGEPAEEVATTETPEDVTEETVAIEEVEVVEVIEVSEGGWTTTVLPAPWPQDFLVQNGMDIVSQEDADGTLVLVAEFAEDTEFGIFDTYDFYYGDCGWDVPEGMGMSCMSDGASLTVYVANDQSEIHIDGDYVEGLFTLTYTLTPVQ